LRYKEIVEYTSIINKAKDWAASITGQDKEAQPKSEPKKVSSGNKLDQYKVQKGDTVYSIAKARGTTPQEVQRLNNLDANFTIGIGQTLLLPKGGAGAAPKKKEEPKKDEKPTSLKDNFKNTVLKYYGKPVTEDDLKLLIKTGAGEADVEHNSREKAYIVATVLNRVNGSGEFSKIKNIAEAVYQKDANGIPQFHCTDGNNERFNNPSQELQQQVMEAVVKDLPSVPKSQKFFGSLDSRAYSNSSIIWKYRFITGENAVKLGGSIFCSELGPYRESFKLLLAKEPKKGQRHRNIINKRNAALRSKKNKKSDVV